MLRFVIAAWLLLWAQMAALGVAQARPYLLVSLGAGILDYEEEPAMSPDQDEPSPIYSDSASGAALGFVAGYQFSEPFVSAAELLLEYRSAAINAAGIEIGMPLMAGLMLRLGFAVPLGGPKLEAYVSGGGLLGQVQQTIASGDSEEIAGGFRVGGGLIFHFSDHWGARLAYHYSWLPHQGPDTPAGGEGENTLGVGTGDILFQHHDAVLGVQYTF